MAYCNQCGEELQSGAKFCSGCGTEVSREEEISGAEQIVAQESIVEVPKGLTLMPEEKILEQHMHFYISNKRLIKHKSSMLGHDTEDYHFRHIKGIQENHRKPFLQAGLVIGVLSLFLGLFSEIFFIIGAALIVLAFWYKKAELVVMHMDGGEIVIPEIKSESGKKVAKVLRTQMYD